MRIRKKRKAVLKRRKLAGGRVTAKRAGRSVAAKTVRRKRFVIRLRRRKRSRRSSSYKRLYNKAFDRAYNEGFQQGYAQGFRDGL